MSNFSRWFNYAKARLDAAVGQGHRDLDELEAEREAELADKPWLSSTSDAPTFDEAKARIEWEAQQAARAGGRSSGHDDGTSRVPDRATAPNEPNEQPGDATGGTGSAVTSPEERAAAADAATARLEMDARERASAARLDAIRAELGIEPAEPPPADEA